MEIICVHLHNAVRSITREPSSDVVFLATYQLKILQFSPNNKKVDQVTEICVNFGLNLRNISGTKGLSVVQGTFSTLVDVSSALNCSPLLPGFLPQSLQANILSVMKVSCLYSTDNRTIG